MIRFSARKARGRERLQELQGDVHETFKQAVRDSRGARLKESEDLFSGAFWSGGKALELGLVDGLGEMHAVLKQKFGDKTEILEIPKPGALAAAAFGRLLGRSRRKYRCGGRWMKWKCVRSGRVSVYSRVRCLNWTGGD